MAVIATLAEWALRSSLRPRPNAEITGNRAQVGLDRKLFAINE